MAPVDVQAQAGDPKTVRGFRESSFAKLPGLLTPTELACGVIRTDAEGRGKRFDDAEARLRQVRGRGRKARRCLAFGWALILVPSDTLWTGIGHLHANPSTRKLS
jgi:hypothetical protein